LITTLSPTLNSLSPIFIDFFFGAGAGAGAGAGDGERDLILASRRRSSMAALVALSAAASDSAFWNLRIAS